MIFKITGKCSSVLVSLFPAPLGTGIIAARYQKDVILMSGIKDCYTRCFGNTRSSYNTIKATFKALQLSYKYLTPDLWEFSR